MTKPPERTFAMDGYKPAVAKPAVNKGYVAPHKVQQKAIESATKLKVDLVETTRAQMNSTETFMVVGTKPF